MSIVQVQGGGGRIVSDRTSFVGVRIPTEIKVMIKAVNKLDKDIFRRLLKLVIQSLEAEKEIAYTHFQEIVQGTNGTVTEETLGIVYTGLLSLLRCAFRHSATSLKQQHFKEDLEELGCNALWENLATVTKIDFALQLFVVVYSPLIHNDSPGRMPAEFHGDLASCIFGTKRPSLDKRLLDARPRLPLLEQLKWRVDVAISTSVLNRVLEPTILMEMTLSSGQTKIFEVPVAQFHQLRYSVAYVLKQMEELEKRSILKIQD